MLRQRTRALILLLALPSAVGAQVSPVQPTARQEAPQPSPRQRAALEQQDAELAQAARQVIEMVDPGRAGEVWDGASAAIKRLVPREEFIRQVGVDRGRLGAPLQRGVPLVTRGQFRAGGQVPQGRYVNVATPTKFEKTEQPIRELVSFRLDEDHVWRVSGYSLR